MNDPTKSCPYCRETIDGAATRCPRCTQRQPDAPGLYRNVPGRLTGGVCAALAQSFGWDVTLVRVLAVASMAVTGGLVLWVYGLMWFLTPFEQGGRSPAHKLIDWVSGLFAHSSASPENDHPTG